MGLPSVWVPRGYCDYRQGEEGLEREGGTADGTYPPAPLPCALRARREGGTANDNGKRQTTTATTTAGLIDQGMCIAISPSDHVAARFIARITSYGYLCFCFGEMLTRCRWRDAWMTVRPAFGAINRAATWAKGRSRQTGTDQAPTRAFAGPGGGGRLRPSAYLLPAFTPPYPLPLASIRAARAKAVRAALGLKSRTSAISGRDNSSW